MWKKNFRNKRMQVAILFLITALSVLLLNSAINMLKSLDRPIESFAKECNAAQMKVTLYSNEEESVKQIINRFQEIEGVSQVEQVPYSYITEEMQCNGKKLTSYSTLAIYNDNVYRKARVIDGEFCVSQYGNDECAIPACLANEFDIKVGDVVQIGTQDEKKEYVVRAIYTDPYNMSNAFDNRILVGNLPKTDNMMLMVYLDNTTVKEVVAEYRNEFGELYANVDSLDDAIDNSLLAAHITGGVFLGVGIIMLLVSCIVIYFVIRNSVLKEAKKIAIYKTMGYTYVQILMMYLKFYLLIVSLGAATGVVISCPVASSMLASLFTNIGEVARLNVFYPGVLTFLGTILLVMGMIYLIIRRMKNIKPVFALNDMSNRNTKKKKQNKRGVSLAFSPMGIAFYEFTRNKRGAAGIIITSIVTIFAINFAILSLDTAYSMKENNDYWFGIDKCGLLIGVSGEDALTQTCKLLDDNEDVISYVKNTVLDQPKVMLQYQEGLENTTLYPYVYESYEKLSMPLTEGRNPSNYNEIAISTVVADSMGKQPGDYITLTIGGDCKVTLLITGLYQTYVNMGASVRMLASTYTQYGAKLSYTSLSVYVKENADREQIIDELKAGFTKGQTVSKREDCFESIMDMIAEPQKKGIPPIMILVLIIGAVNIFSIVLLKNTQNKKRYQIYKSIGYTTKDLILSNMIYVGAIAIVSILVAVPVLILSYSSILKLCLSVFSFRQYPVTVNYIHVILGNLLVFLVFGIATAGSYRSLKKMDVRDLIID